MVAMAGRGGLSKDPTAAKLFAALQAIQFTIGLGFQVSTGDS